MNPTKTRPAFRLRYSANEGTDANGQSKLSYPVEIGVAFERNDASKGLIARFTIIPEDMRDGVLFLVPADASADDGDAGQEVA